MKKHTPIYIWSPLILENYYVSYGVPKKLFKDAVKRILNYDLDYRELHFGYCMVFERNDDNRIIWIWTKTKNVSALAHEAVHAAYYSLEDKMKWGKDTHEMYCYLVQMIVQNTLKPQKK